MKATNDVNGLIFKDEVYDIKKQAARVPIRESKQYLEALEKAKVSINGKCQF